jgi:hypothetical protein
MRYLILILLVGCSSVERKPTEEQYLISYAICSKQEKFTVVYDFISDDKIVFHCNKNNALTYKVKTRK